MEKKWMLLLLAIGVFVVLFGAKGITGAVSSDISGGMFSSTALISIVAIIAIAGLVITTQIVNRK